MTIRSLHPSFVIVLQASKKSDKSPATVFVFDKKTSNLMTLRLAKNHHLKLKTIRHPNVLKLLDSCEIDTGIYIATEECMPLLCTGTFDAVP